MGIQRYQAMKHLRNILILTIPSSLILLFSGCADGGDKTVLRGEESQGSPASGGLVIFNWDDYVAPEVVADFEAETGIKVTIETYESLGELSGRLQSTPDAFDLVVVDDVTLNELRDVRLIQEIDHREIPNMKNIAPRYLDQDFDPGNRFSIPYLWGTTLVAFRADKIGEPKESWNLLWDPSLKGKVAMMDEKEDLYAAALLSLGHPLNTEDPKELQDAFEYLVKQREVVAPVYQPLGEVEELLVSGKVWAAMLYSGDAAMLAEEDDRIQYFIPDEGAPIWMDNLAIAREAKNVESAHLFIDFISRGNEAAKNANYLWSATPNQAASPHLSEDLLADSSVYPSQSVVAKCDFHAQPSQKRLETINRGMKRLFDEARANVAVVPSAIDAEEGESPE